MKKSLIFLIMLCCSSLFANSEYKGLYGSAGIGLGHLKIISDRGAKGLGAMIDLKLGYRFKNIEISASTDLMADPVRFENGYPVNGARALTKSSSADKGGIVKDVNIILSAGYNLIVRENDAPLYIGASLIANNYAITPGNAPVYADFQNSYLSIDLQGVVALQNPQYKLLYSLSYDVCTDSSVVWNFAQETREFSTQEVKAKSCGDGARASIGVKKALGERISIFAKLFAKYHKMGAVSDKLITISANSTFPSIVPNSSAVVSQPKSDVLFYGLNLGILF